MLLYGGEFWQVGSTVREEKSFFEGKFALIAIDHQVVGEVDEPNSRNGHCGVVAIRWFRNEW